MKKQDISTILIVICLILVISIPILSIYDRELTEVETYSVGMQIIDKNIQKPENVYIFTLNGTGENTRLKVSSSEYNKYEVGEILEVEITVKETAITHADIKFYKILGLCLLP